MKIVFTGGGTGGHFYPLIAVSEEIDKYAFENQLVLPKKYYFGPEKYDENALYDANMKYIYCPAGKLRRTRDIGSRIKNFFSMIAIFFGGIKATLSLFSVFPDVVFSKGGYTAFPVLLAARILGIPVVIHESDSKFGMVTKWSAKFAKYIAISYPETHNLLTDKQKEISALTGVPIRRELYPKELEDAHEYIGLDKDIKTILVLGGSSGAVRINNFILDSIDEVSKKYQVIHQTGKPDYQNVLEISEETLENMKDVKKYIVKKFLTAYQLRSALSIADVVITRAGSGTLAEIAAWGIPAIVIPIPEEVSHDQRSNAYAFSRETGNIVMEEQNLTTHLLVSQIDNLITNKIKIDEIKTKSKEFAKLDSSKKIADLLVQILKTHEK